VSQLSCWLKVAHMILPTCGRTLQQTSIFRMRLAAIMILCLHLN
jgi:hypothetical protein